MTTPTTPRLATQEELVEHLRGLLAFVYRENRESLEWMIERPQKRLKLDRVLNWLDHRFVERHSFGKLDADRFCELVDDQLGIVVPFEISKHTEFWWREPHVAHAQAAEHSMPEIGNLAYLSKPGELAAAFCWEDDWVDHSYLTICRRRP